MSANNHQKSDPSGGASNAPVEESFTDANVDPKRRKLLVRGAAALGGLGGVALAAPLISSMFRVHVPKRRVLRWKPISASSARVSC